MKGDSDMYNLKEQEMIFAFTGPDGAGRKTVAKMVGDTLGLKTVVSYTTRKKRHYEVDGTDYHFVSVEEFLEAEKNEEFFESVEIDGRHYGIKEKDIVERFEQKGCIYLVLNIEGTEQLKEKFQEKVVRVFVNVDRDTAIERQRERGNTEEEIELHMKHFDEDVQYQSKCEHAVQNYELSHTIFEVTQIVEKHLLEKSSK